MRGENYMLQYFCRTGNREIDIFCSRIQVAIFRVREVFYSLTFCSVRLLLPAVTTFTGCSGTVLPHDESMITGLIFYRTHEVDTRR